METLHSGRVGHLELILDDRDVYYVKVGSKSSVTCVAPATFPGICTPPSQSPSLIIATSFGVLAILSLPPSNNICDFSSARKV